MEDIHGVDVSWLHHSNPDRATRLHTPASARPPVRSSAHSTLTKLPEPAMVVVNGGAKNEIKAPTAQPVKATVPSLDTSANGIANQTGTPHPASIPISWNAPAGTVHPVPSPPRAEPVAATTSPILAGLSRAATLPTPTAPSSSAPNGTNTTSTNGHTNGTPPATPQSKPPPRRPGLTAWASADRVLQSASPARGRRGSFFSNVSSRFGKVAEGHGPVPRAESPAPVGGAVQPPDRPVTPPQRGGSFFSNALRRLSTSAGAGSAVKAGHAGGLCPRRVMNVDRSRPRCVLPELNAAKLRKVAFCVDVEIAGGPKYVDDEAEEEERKRRKNREKMKERGEGEALKHPEEVAQQKEAEGVVKAAPEVVGTSEDPVPEGIVVEENGPAKFDVEKLPEKPPASRPADRPTTDPLRIYRRCCQLREVRPLKRLTEQLGNSSNCPVQEPGTVCELDLTGSRLRLPDLVTLSDWLAVVPVKKLILDDADLTDEGIRVILAGLLAAKTADAQVRRCHLANGIRDGKPVEQAGVVEKLSLKNNPKISKEGWKHISLFIYMSPSIKALDVSMNIFPSTLKPLSDSDSGFVAPDHTDIAEIFSKALCERLAGDRLEELIMTECALSAPALRKIIDGVAISGLKRLGIAGNAIDAEGMTYVTHYLRSGVCQGLDLGGNDLSQHIDVLTKALTPKCPLWALSLADCALTPALLKSLLPGLLILPNLRFLDLSHNQALFTARPNALALLRKSLPLLPHLKRIHLMDIALSPAQAIALAEIIPECPSLAHINLLHNPALAALAAGPANTDAAADEEAQAADEEAQEEACALYAALLAAARTSSTLICVDIDPPSPSSGPVVKALARQVVAYCLRNVERCAAEVAGRPADAPDVAVPSVLAYLVGGGVPEDDDTPGADYIVGGTGVVKALAYCLRGGEEGESRPGTPTHEARAKAVSVNLLDSARKVRARLRPALIREARGGDDMAYRRLLFLEHTLRGIIGRFEDEYPECRVEGQEGLERMESGFEGDVDIGGLTAGEESDGSEGRRPMRRGDSEVNLQARKLAVEEGQMLRMGAQVKRELGLDGGEEGKRVKAPEGEGEDSEQIALLRSQLDSFRGEEIREHVRREGWEAAARRVGEVLEGAGVRRFGTE
ncbi:RNI-like protein [Trichodelitschia bisporula]|uniref:RNI-like protein n=1 Tax=Trichodelitschia bisporula TaxID=703511 RepID=A0A6G1HP97_9PEZI|nr:RNI-like protein [Trichodelitschia bisporula]